MRGCAGAEPEGSSPEDFPEPGPMAALLQVPQEELTLLGREKDAEGQADPERRAAAHGSSSSGSSPSVMPRRSARERRVASNPTGVRP